jgi:hypothetical protein
MTTQFERTPIAAPDRDFLNHAVRWERRAETVKIL